MIYKASACPFLLCFVVLSGKVANIQSWIFLLSDAVGPAIQEEIVLLIGEHKKCVTEALDLTHQGV